MEERRKEGRSLKRVSTGRMEGKRTGDKKKTEVGKRMWKKGKEKSKRNKEES